MSTVLLRFSPPSGVKVTYPGCTKSDAPRSYKGDVLVLAMFYRPDLCGSRKELVVPATAANLPRAQFLLNADLKKRISRYLRDHRSPRHWKRVLVFEGTVRDPVPHSQQPMPCKVQPPVPINYDVEQVLRGDWTDTGSHRVCFDLSVVCGVEEMLVRQSEFGMGIPRNPNFPTIPILRSSKSRLTCHDRWPSKRRGIVAVAMSEMPPSSDKVQ